jgi:thiosulfate/3-mercaptopyruvate sulfurtransferase
VTERTTVVVYDDFDGSLAARLWWVLRYYGHDRVKLLDGGWHRWVIERLPLSEQERPHDAGRFVARPRPEMMCSIDDLLERLGSGTTTVVDVRERAEWQGTDANLWGHRRKGRIPGSVHLDPAAPFTEDLRTFRTSEELRALLDRAGVPEQGDVVLYCQVAAAAAIGALVLHLLDRADALVYEGSMAEWANRDDTPMEADAQP